MTHPLSCSSTKLEPCLYWAWLIQGALSKQNQSPSPMTDPLWRQAASAIAVKGIKTCILQVHSRCTQPCYNDRDIEKKGFRVTCLAAGGLLCDAAAEGASNGGQVCGGVGILIFALICALGHT